MAGLKIALVGKMRSGKDTVADYLAFKYNFKVYAFADGIKELCKQLFPHLVEGRKNRSIYQDVGQFMRSIDPHVWINQTMKRISRFSPLRNIVISDVRQQNEYDVLKSKGYIIIKIHADDEIRWERIRSAGDDCTEEQFNHETERAVDTIPHDFLITNNETLDELYKQIKDVLDGISQNR